MSKNKRLFIFRSKRNTLKILFVTILSLTFSCEDIEYGVEDNYGDEFESRASHGCLPSKNMNWTYRSGDKLPLGQSRPGAKVTLFFDFDGGSYSGVSSGRVSSSYDSSERAHIERQVEQVAGNYARWNINVTTDKTVFNRATKRARILIATGEGSSGMASTNGISSSDRHTGYVGVDAVFDSDSKGYKCAYVMTHEFGHNFTLRGTTEDYADMYPNATIGAFMGGRDRQFKGYRWIALTNKKGKWQDPDQIIGNIAGTVDDNVIIDNDDCDDQCSSSCRCDVNEGDCDRDSDCKLGLYCKQQSGTDYCQRRPTNGCDGQCSNCTEAGERKQVTLSCPSGEKIARIDFASYGLPIGSCNGGFQYGSCHASGSKSRVEGACLNQQRCFVSVSNDMFGDPCKGKYKKLAITYTCSGGGSGDDGGGGGGVTGKCAEVDERDTETLSCSNGEVIGSIDFASYGVPKGSCSSGFSRGSCHASSSKSKVEISCRYKQSCKVSANNAVFGDPCKGTHKKLAVTYTCKRFR